MDSVPPLISAMKARTARQPLQHRGVAGHVALACQWRWCQQCHSADQAGAARAPRAPRPPRARPQGQAASCAARGWPWMSSSKKWTRLYYLHNSTQSYLEIDDKHTHTADDVTVTALHS